MTLLTNRQSPLWAHDQPDVIPLEDLYWFMPRYQVRREYIAYWNAADGRVASCTIPAGFTSDGSTEWIVSLLLFFWPAGILWLFGIRADGPHRAAAVVHDYLYAKRKGTRYEADYAFLQLNLRAGVPAWRAYTRYFVLRVVGWVWWYT